MHALLDADRCSKKTDLMVVQGAAWDPLPCWLHHFRKQKAAAASPCRCTIKLQVWTRHQQATDVLVAVYLLALCSVGSALQYAAYERHWAQKVQHLAVALTAIMSGQGS